jgi:hypothetical protein
MSGPQPVSAREQLAVVAAFVPRIKRAAWLGGVILAVGLVGTAIWALSSARLYRSEAVLLYERGIQSEHIGAGEGGESIHQVASRLQDMFTSRSRLEAIIKEMKLYRKTIDQRGLVEAIDEMRKHLQVTPREGLTFRVSYDADSRELAQKVLERVIKSVLDSDSQRRVREADDTKKFLDTERKHADEDLKAKEGALSTFLTQHPQFAAETGANAAAAGGLLRAADRDRAPAGDVAGLELQAAQLEEALAAAGQKPGAAPGEPLLDPNLAAARQRAMAEQQAAQRDLSDKEARFTNEHPDVKAAQRRLSAAEMALRRAEAAIALRPAPPPMAPAPGDEVGQARVTALRRQLSIVRAQIGKVRAGEKPRVEAPRETRSMVAIETEWTRLMRDTNEARERQSQLESKQFQAQLMATLTSGGQGGRIVVADAPFRPNRPIAGSRFKIAMVGGVASLLFAMLGILGLAAVDDRLYAPRDLERVMTNTLVIAIPRVTTDKNG